MWQDFRHGLRALVKQPSFAAGTILVLGLAVGVNTAVFSLINALLLRPLPVSAPERLGFVYPSDDSRFSVSWRAYQLLQQKTNVFDAMTARTGDTASLRLDGTLLPLAGEAVAANYFDVLGVAPLLGRRFTPDEEQPAAAPVAMISEALWRSQFGGDASVIGRVLPLHQATFAARYQAPSVYTIIGVVPTSFRGTGNPWQPASFWVPLPHRANDWAAGRPADRREPIDVAPAMPIGRLKPGVSFAAAAAAVDAAARDILMATSRERLKPGETFVFVRAPRFRLPFRGAYFMSVPRVAMALMAVAMTLLVIAASNLAGMLLARGFGRRTELAVRLSLGAPRWRVIRQLTAESVVFAAGGAMAGIAIAKILVATALHQLPAQLAGASAASLAVDVPLDGRVVTFACVTCLLTAIVVGLIPALATVRADLLSSLTSSGILAPRAVRSRTRRFVLVPQVALSLVLLLLTGVIVRALLRLELAAPGYDADRVAVLNFKMPIASFNATAESLASDAAKTRAAIDRILPRIKSLPDVTAVAITGSTIQGVALPEAYTSIIARSDYGTTNTHRGVTYATVSSDYFAVMGIAVLRGRTFDDRDRQQRAVTTIVSERLANEIWPGRDPIGEAIAFHSANSGTPLRWMEVVGVVRSVTLPAEEFPRPVFYVPLDNGLLDASTLIVRGQGAPALLIARVKDAIREAAPEMLVAQARPLDDAIDAVRYPRRFSAALLGASGVTGLLLAAIGMFGLMSYAVAQRVGEIGVRMMLGADRRDVMRLILRDGLASVLAGLAIGFTLAFAAIRYASHAIVPLPAADPLTFIVVPTVVLAAVFLACYLPARRAARVDPLVILRRV